MKTSSILFLVLSLLTTYKVARSKNCSPHVSYFRNGSSYNYQGVPIDTTVSISDSLYDPFFFQPFDECILTGGNGLCEKLYVACYFNGIQICYYTGFQVPIRVLLPHGIEGTLVDSCYYTQCEYHHCLVAQMTVHISDESETGVTENYSSNFVRVYPNPFSGKISFTLLDHADRFFSIVIYDLNGRLIESLSSHFDDLDMKKEESGFYFYSAITENGKNYRGKIFKQ